MAKCRICKIDIKPLADDFIRLKQKFYYHTECYKDREANNLVPIEIVNDVISVAKKEYQEDQDKKTKKYKNKNIRNGIDDLTNWIQESYDIEFLPKTFYLKLSSIANGTYKGLKEPITYIDLLDMLQRRKRQLDIKLASKKFNSHLHRFYYDLAIVLSQYESYKKWKIAQEIQREEIVENLQSQKKYSGNQSVLSNKQQNNEDSVENILDEIFG